MPDDKRCLCTIRCNAKNFREVVEAVLQYADDPIRLLRGGPDALASDLVHEMAFLDLLPHDADERASVAKLIKQNAASIYDQARALAGQYRLPETRSSVRPVGRRHGEDAMTSRILRNCAAMLVVVIVIFFVSVTTQLLLLVGFSCPFAPPSAKSVQERATDIRLGILTGLVAFGTFALARRALLKRE